MHEPDQEPTADMEVMTGPGGADREPGRRRSRRARAVTAAATVVVLALGGTVAYAATSGGSGQGATPSASGSASPSPGGPRDRHGGGRWFGAGGMGVHGEATVKDQETGKWITRTWQRGTVEKIDGDQVTVKSEDGASWTWTVNSGTTVLRDGTKASGAGALKKDDTAFLIGTRADNGTRTATHALEGTWGNRGPGDKGGPGDGHGKFPGHRNWRMPAPSTSPSDNGATT
ncbi:hypothetical protein [Streptomyces sp. NPDC048419]|uniref:hypothetical protein n=1 Tax=Streptomyces sp. NPDC048419 TaxID=3365547 RepID=UPI003715FDDF